MLLRYLRLEYLCVSIFDSLWWRHMDVNIFGYQFLERSGRSVFRLRWTILGLRWTILGLRWPVGVLWSKLSGGFDDRQIL